MILEKLTDEKIFDLAKYVFRDDKELAQILLTNTKPTNKRVAFFELIIYPTRLKYETRELEELKVKIESKEKEIEELQETKQTKKTNRLFCQYGVLIVEEQNMHNAIILVGELQKLNKMKEKLEIKIELLSELEKE
jgi:hypothetical protein